MPWLVVRIARRVREFGDRTASLRWQAGLLALLLPLAGTLGLLALPDVPMALATLLCVDAGARLLRKVDAGGCARTRRGPGDRRAQPLPLHRR